MLKFLKKLVLPTAGAAILVTIFIISINIYWHNQLEPYLKNSTEITSLEPRPVALVLGAGLNKNATPSLILTDRLEVGYKLLATGKVDKLILSGDNRVLGYNEPEAMKKYLLQKGAPEKSLVLDYAGRRTYDSCYRTQKIFGQQKIYVITQNFHITRAVYLCRSLGIDTIGISSDLQQYRGIWIYTLRDYVSFANAFLDIKILQPLPVLGERVEVE